MTLFEFDLLGIMPTARGRSGKYFSLLREHMRYYDIDSPLRVCHFLSQLAHESGELRYVEELASGRAYEGRKDLGNVEQGDGVRFKGRGFLQLTGRRNYALYGAHSGSDVVGCPELLCTPYHAVRSACWFWHVGGLNGLADVDDVRAVTRRINGGLNGLADRMKYLNRAKRILL